MKRIIAIVLVLMLAISLMPASALADDGIYLSVGNKSFSASVQTINIGGGTATLTWDVGEPYLTLENMNLDSFWNLGKDASGTSCYAAIAYSGRYKLKIYCKNCRITAPQHGSNCVYEGIVADGPVYFYGDLEITGVDVGVDVTTMEYGSGDSSLKISATTGPAIYGNRVLLYCSTDIESHGACAVMADYFFCHWNTGISLKPDFAKIGYCNTAAVAAENVQFDAGCVSINVNADYSGYKGNEALFCSGISANEMISVEGWSKDDVVSCNVNVNGNDKIVVEGMGSPVMHFWRSGFVRTELNLIGSHALATGITCDKFQSGGNNDSIKVDSVINGAGAGDAAFFVSESYNGYIVLSAMYAAVDNPDAVAILINSADELCSKIGEVFDLYGETDFTHIPIPLNIHTPAKGSIAELRFDGYSYKTVVDTDGKPADVVVMNTREYSFRDIDNTNTAPYKNAILWAVNNGITNGFTPVEFRPNADCTRGQVVTFLWRAKGCPEPTITENPFVDVTSTSPFYKAILWAYENGITTGFDETHFKPSNPCTRAQVVTFLWRSEGKPAPESEENPFVDVSSTGSTAPYYTAILWAAEQGITSGYGNNDFRPNVTCNRAQIVTFIYRDVRQPQIAARGNIADIALEVNPESSADKSVSLGGYLFKEADKGVTWDYFPVNVTVTYENGSTDTVTAMLPRMNSTEGPAVNVLGHYGDRVVLSYDDGVTELFTAVIIDTESVKAMTPTKEGLTLQGDIGLSGQYVTIYGGGYFHIFDMGDGGVFRVRIGSGSDTPNGDVDVFAIVDHYVFFADYGYRTKFNVETQTYDPVCVAARVYRADLDQNANKSTQIANIDNAVSFMLDETGYTVQYYTDNTCTEVGETVHYDFIFPN